MQSPKVFEIFSLLLTDKIHFWQDVCLKDCDHLHQFNLRYYKPNVLPCVGAPPYRYNIMISLTRCTFSRICIFGNVYYSSLKIWISVQYINIKSSRMFLNVNKTKTKQHNPKKNVTWTWRNVGIMIKYFEMTNYCNINFAMTGIFILLLSLMVMMVL